MFRRLPEAGAATVPLTIDGGAALARAGDSVAAALIAAGRVDCRTTPVSGKPRGPYCMMGVCFDCLVEIDGRPNQQACMVEVQPGMQVARQEGPRAVDASAAQ
jgi:predicted molibdopterin-dependent oxidoreductase YjgC